MSSLSPCAEQHGKRCGNPPARTSALLVYSFTGVFSSNRIFFSFSAAGDFTRFVVPYLDGLHPETTFIFPDPTSQDRLNRRASVNVALRNANDEPKLENRSLRRGSLQQLARAGMSKKALLACSGHSTEKSLKRYLNFGRVPAADQVEAKPFMMSIAKPEGAVRASC